METTIEDRRASNAMAPISKLNDDILSHISMLNAHLDFVDIHIPSTTIRRTSQVNQRWRDLLLNYPLVWATSLDMGDPKAWIDIVLARARTAPLNLVLPSISRLVPQLREGTLLDLHLGSETLSQVQQQQMREADGPSDAEVDFALSLLPRCRQFTMKIISRNTSDIITKMTSLTVGPQLQELTLCVMYPLKKICICEDSAISVSQGSSAPALKLLDLMGCRTNFLLPSFQSLTTLFIGNEYGWDRIKTLTAHACLKILRRLPQLEALALRHCLVERALPKPGASHEDLITPISLSCLRSLALEGHCEPCHEVLSALRFPGSCSLHIEYFKVDDILYPVFDMMSELCRKVQLLVQSAKIQGLALKEISQSYFYMTNTSHRHKFPKATIFTIALDGVHDINRIPRLAELLRLVSPSVTDLWFDVCDIYGEIPSVEKTFLDPFDQVNVLAFSNEESLSIVAAIHNQSDFATSHLTFPRLSMLSLYRVYFNSDDYVQAFVDLLHRRLEIKAPISYIRMEDCGGNEKETLMTKLREIEVEIELDEGSRGYRHPKWP